MIKRSESIEDRNGIVTRTVLLEDTSHDKRGVQVGAILWELQSLQTREILVTEMKPVMWPFRLYKMKRVSIVTNLTDAGTSGKWQQGPSIPAE